MRLRNAAIASPLPPCSDRACPSNAMSAALLNATRTPVLPRLTRILPPFCALCSASHFMTSGSSLVLPSNSRTPTISSSLRRFTIVHAFLKFSARIARCVGPLRDRCCNLGSNYLDFEQIEMPGSMIDKETVLDQIGAVAQVNLAPHDIGKTCLGAAHIRERQFQTALGLIPGIVDGDNMTTAGVAFPDASDETVRRPVAGPCDLKSRSVTRRHHEMPRSLS